jgi:hypothetical protein
MVTGAGRGHLHSYRQVADGTHTDGLVPLAAGILRPMLPSFVEGLGRLEAWTGRSGG